MRRLTAKMILGVMALTPSLVSARTVAYTFVTGQSTVTQVSSLGQADRLYSIEGKFQLSVDPGSGAASFDWVDAKLGTGADIETRSLGELFRMTELTGTAVSATTIEFVLNDVGPWANGQTEITVTLSNGSATLSGEHSQLSPGGSVFTLDAVASEQSSGWTYHYVDDFLTGKAERDSYAHSIFWAGDAFPPSEPYLYYHGGNESRGLVLMNVQGQPAHLGYHFPIGPHAGRQVKGLIELDIAFPSDGSISQSPQGYLFYSLSEDGHNWSVPAMLAGGHHRIQVESLQGACYLMLLGTRVMVDNLEVHLASPPATISVPGAFETIQAAIDSSADGDVIEVGPGVYKGVGNTDIDFHGKAITVRSSDGPESTVIDCSGSTALAGARVQANQQGHQGRGFYFHSAETRRSVLRGFTIRSGRIKGDVIPADGMRWNLDPAHPIGGGIYCEFASPTIVDCVLRNCGTEYGGGIGCVGGEPAIVGCLVENCSAGGYGEMRSGGHGGGIALIRGCDAVIADCRVISNTGYYNSEGGGLYCRRSVARVTGCDISFNGPVSESSMLAGGGLYCEGAGSKVTATNCVVSHNIAQSGSAIMAVGLAKIPEQPICTVRVTNCTLANNRLMPTVTLPPVAEVAVQSVDCDTKVKNSIVWSNDGVQILISGPATVGSVVYCDVQGGYAGVGNIDDDPLFAPVDSRDYHVQSLYGRYDPRLHGWVRDAAHSPCIDAGDPNDYSGYEPLPNGKRINMGAYGGSDQASRGIGNLAYHVDTVKGDDRNNGLGRERAFATIQKGVDSASDGDVVLVWPGVYREQVDFKGKAITVQSAADAAEVVAPVGYAFSFFKNEGRGSVLRNFVIRDSEHAVFCMTSFPTLSNLTIVENGFGVAAYGGANPAIRNCIFWANVNGDLFQCGADYSRLRSGQLQSGEGNIDDDPLFGDAVNGDYHLRSQFGRYWAERNVWVLDEQSSRCIDGGDPEVRPSRERMPNGGRLNMGAYGGTPYASLSEWLLRGDVNRDGIVSFRDMAIMGRQWRQRTLSGSGGGAGGLTQLRLKSDVDGDGVVGQLDLSVLAQEWLEREDWPLDAEPGAVIPGVLPPGFE